MKKLIAMLAGLSVFLLVPAASGAILSYDFIVNAGGSWIGGDPRPYGLSLQPGPMAGSLTVDNTRTDKTGIVDFFFTTGVKTWAENLITDSPVITKLTYGASGELTDFMINAGELSALLILASTDTMYLDDGATSIACNRCVDFFPAPTVTTPVPGTLALLFAAGLAGALIRRRQSVA